MVRYPKYLLVIRDKVIDIASGTTGNFDISQTAPTLTLEIPYINKGGLDTSTLQYGDSVQVYFKYYSTFAQAQEATIENMKLVFYGYIEEPVFVEDSNGLQISLTCKGTAGLLYKFTTQTKFYNSNLPTIINDVGAQVPGIFDYIPNILIDSNITPVLKVDAEYSFGKVIDGIRSKYAIQIYQKGNGDLIFRWPWYLTANSAVGYIFDLQDNVIAGNWGNRANAYDTVIVVGSNCVGIAFDPIAYQLKMGVKTSELQQSVTPDTSKLNIYFEYRRDIISEVECNEVARNILIDFAKNYTISFDITYEPNIELGEVCQIKNSRVLPESQVWTIKSMSVNWDSLVSTLTCYSGSIIDFPSDILLQKQGILDIDILNVPNTKVKSALNIN